VKKLSGISRSLPFYLLASGVYLMIVFKDIFSNGMFLDGLIYSTVSRNMAEGLGTFWNPHFTSTLLSDSHEHPPLAFGIQSIFFTILGQSRYVDRLYSVLTVVISGYIILNIWKTLGNKNGWFPLLIWLVTPTVFWASYNNLLENTLTIFTSLSILFYLKNINGKKPGFLILSGFMLSLGFLTKGFVAFFPWTFPFLLWLFLNDKSFGRMVTDSILIVFFTVSPIILLILLFPTAAISLHNYVDNQVINSIKNIVTVNSRFDILIRLINELAPVVCLSVLILIHGRIRKSKVVIEKKNLKQAMAFAALGLTGVLPIMISMKQSGFYILPTYPFFSIAAGILMYPYISSVLSKIDYESKGFIFFKWIGYGIFILGMIMSILYSDHYSRDKNLIKDTYAVSDSIPGGITININPDMYEEWSLHGYFARFGNISLDPDLSNKRDYLLIRNEEYSDTLKTTYNIININTSEFQLLKMK
jgi:4-amino-4-deoxy-L-arabinose transferase-like glycosyltransferase